MRKCERAKTATSYANCKGSMAKKAAKAHFKMCTGRAKGIKGRSRKAKAQKKQVLEQCLRSGSGPASRGSSYSAFAKQYAPSPRPPPVGWRQLQKSRELDRERLVHPFEGAGSFDY